MNTASRMETTGVPGCIQVTERTRRLLGERYVFQERGVIQVKAREDAHLLPERAYRRRRLGPGLTGPVEPASRRVGMVEAARQWCVAEVA